MDIIDEDQLGIFFSTTPNCNTVLARAKVLSLIWEFS